MFIAREQPGKRTEAVASVLIDRVVGLYAMILVATAGYFVGARAGEFSATVHALGGRSRRWRSSGRSASAS